MPQVAELRSCGSPHHGQTVEVEADSGATSTANWWAHATKQTRAAAHRKTRLAAALGSEAFEPDTGGAGGGSAAGRPGPGDRGGGGGDCPPTSTHRSRRMRRRRWSGTPSTTTPGSCGSSATGSWRSSPRRSARPTKPGCWRREEREAEAAASFRMVEDGHGRCHGRFTISALHGAMLRKQLLAIAAPKHRASSGRRRHPNPDARPRTGWGRRSRSTSRPTPPTGSRTPAAWRPRSWSP